MTYEVVISEEAEYDLRSIYVFYIPDDESSKVTITRVLYGGRDVNKIFDH